MTQSSVVNPKFGELNSTEHSNEPESLEPENLSGIDLIQKNNENLTKPNVIKKIVGPYKGIAFRGVGDQTKVQKTSQSKLSDLSFGLFGAESLQKTRIRIPELHSHLPELGEDLNNVPATIAAMYPEFIAESEEVPEPSPGTIVWCNFLDRENFKNPTYLGPVDPEKTGTSGGTSSSQSGVSLAGNAAAGDQIGGIKNNSGQITNPLSEQKEKLTPGMYEIATAGKSEGMVEMVYIEGTELLYPKKYIKALESMRQAYKKETGQVLGLTSAYRSVERQKQLYCQYLARNKAAPATARPGFSLHNNGRAVDIATGKNFNDLWEIEGNPPPAEQVAKDRIKTGRYGPVAKWLGENSFKFGYRWIGFGFRELWHYELNVESAISLGLINE